jgi:hypothetical protein
MPGLQLTLALEHYDRHLPLLEGKVKPEGIDLHVAHVTVEGGRGMGQRLARNRKNLERFIQYELDQGLIDRRLEVKELFHGTTHST